MNVSLRLNPERRRIRFFVGRSADERDPGSAVEARESEGPS